MNKQHSTNRVPPRQSGGAARLAAAVLGRLAMAFTWAAMVALTSQNSFAQSGKVENPHIRLGEDAPDFELPRLTITSDANGKPIGIIRESETIRLSSFRGKRPVCLIMSSYT
jgi:hypothetical protein